MSRKTFLVEQLAFERRKEALAHGVVEAVADRAHRRTNADLLAAQAERNRRTLRALVRMVNDGFRAALPQRQVERLEHELGPQVIRRLTADDASTPRVHDHGEV